MRRVYPDSLPTGPLPTRTAPEHEAAFRFARMGQWKWLGDALANVPDGQSLIIDLPDCQDARWLSNQVRALIRRASRVSGSRWTVSVTPDRTEIWISRDKSSNSDGADNRNSTEDTTEAESPIPLASAVRQILWRGPAERVPLIHEVLKLRPGTTRESAQTTVSIMLKRKEIVLVNRLLSIRSADLAQTQDWDRTTDGRLDEQHSSDSPPPPSLIRAVLNVLEEDGPCTRPELFDRVQYVLPNTSHRNIGRIVHYMLRDGTLLEQVGILHIAAVYRKGSAALAGAAGSG